MNMNITIYICRYIWLYIICKTIYNCDYKYTYIHIYRKDVSGPTCRYIYGYTQYVKLYTIHIYIYRLFLGSPGTGKTCAARHEYIYGYT